MLNYGHKFEANYKAGRRDTALAVAAFVFENLDSAITKQKNSDDIRGKQLLIYTDGLNEAENTRQELLGNKRLLELMAATQGLDSHQVIDMLKEAVEEHRAGAEPNDDITLMCLKLKAH